MSNHVTNYYYYYYTTTFRIVYEWQTKCEDHTTYLGLVAVVGWCGFDSSLSLSQTPEKRNGIQAGLLCNFRFHKVKTYFCFFYFFLRLVVSNVHPSSISFLHPILLLTFQTLLERFRNRTHGCSAPCIPFHFRFRFFLS